jgi:rhodanese-related sulfurtransferase
MAPRRKHIAPILVALAAAIATPALADEIRSTVDPSKLSSGKTTRLGLYLTPTDAHRALQADPGIVFLDVRDPIEVSFVGHPASIDANIPLMTATHEFDANRSAYKMVPNPAFVKQVEAWLATAKKGKDAAIFLICRSGGRSAYATNLLADAGYTNVWNLVEGFEGDLDKSTGRRSLNGWRNADLPWAYKLTAEVAYDALDAPGSDG